MLYIFDMGNVLIDIDFKRVLGVWSNLSGTPLAHLMERFTMGDAFQQHERGEITDQQFAEEICDELGIALSFEQFTAGWQSIFVGLRPDAIATMKKLRQAGHRVVVLSNTNSLHFEHWPTHYPEIEQNADAVYLSQQIGLRKPDPAIFQYVLDKEGFSAQEAVFFDDVAENVNAASAIGIQAILVTDGDTLSHHFSGNQIT